MLRNAILILICLPLLAFAAVGTLKTAHVAADSVSDACQGIGLTGGDCNGSASGNRVSTVIKNIINILTAIVGVAAVIMIIIGGFRYVTSGGDANAVSGAKSTVMYAIIGLIIVALAQVIVRFVIGSAK